MYYKRGDKYEGEWKDGKRKGRGVNYCRDGSVFEGYWENDKAQGYGRMVHANGNM